MKRLVRWAATLGGAALALSCITALPAAAADRHGDRDRDHYRRDYRDHWRDRDVYVRPYYGPVYDGGYCPPRGSFFDLNIRL